jgi:hypothetical protein
VPAAFNFVEGFAVHGLRCFKVSGFLFNVQSSMVQGSKIVNRNSKIVNS